MATQPTPPPGRGGNQQRQGQNRGGGGNAPAQTKIVFEQVEVVAATPGIYDLDVVIFVSRGDQPLQTDLQMYVDGRAVSTVRTERDGRIRWTHQRIPAGGFRSNGRIYITAQIPGTANSKQEMVDIPKLTATAKPKAQVFEVNAQKGRLVAPDNQEYTITVQSSTTEAVGAKGEFAWSVEGIPQQRFSTDDSGFHQLTVHAIGLDRVTNCHFRLIGTGKDETLKLETPCTPKYNPGPPPQSGWKERFKYGLKGGRQ